MSGWRFYARRTKTGEWLDTDVQADAALTWGINGGNEADLTIPYGLDRPATDGQPKWLERGTTLYAERPGELWVGLCDYAEPGKDALQVGFQGLLSAYDLIWFNGRISQWEPNPYAVVEALIANAHAQPDGDVGFTVVRDGAPARTAGDPKPESPRPPKPKRRKKETFEHYDDRLFIWEQAVDDWERLYGKREAYSLGWWEQQYVGAEIAELADEIPFTYYERHTGSALNATHTLVLAASFGRRRDDIALIEGVNLSDVVTPATNTERYANHYVVLGAGEGSTMKRGESSVRDARIRTTRFSSMKTVKQVQRLNARAAQLRQAATTSVELEGAKVAGRAAETLRVGDEVPVKARRFTGWCRVSSLTKTTAGSAVIDVAFDRTTEGKIR